MNKVLVERGVNEILLVSADQKRRWISMEKGNGGKWESCKLDATPNCGIMAAMFSHYAVIVETYPCPNPCPKYMASSEGNEYKDFEVFKIDIRWYHRDGGENGASLGYFYQTSTDKFLSPDKANEIYQQMRDKL